MIRRPDRHALLAVDPGAWPRIVRARLDGLDAAQRTVVEDWAALDRPVIVRRPGGCESGDAVAVGLPLPPGLGKLRLALVLPDDVRRTARAGLPLADARDLAPPRLRPAVDRALRVGDEVGVVPDVFGSLLWQALTGLAYVHDGSDLDLLWRPDGVDQARRIAAALAATRDEDGVRLDGELLFAAGGVSWREFADARRDGKRDVLARSLSGVRLIEIDDLEPVGAAAC